jgi:Tol biopolymer transport system component
VFTEWRDKQWHLVKARVGSAERMTLRSDGTSNASPVWSPKDDWITWESEQGLMVVATDGSVARPIYDGQFIVHTWSPNGKEILGIEDTEERRLVLRLVADIGASPPVNNPVKGLAVHPDGRRVATSISQLRGDLWIMSGLRRRGWLERLRWAFRPAPIETP